MSIYKTAVNKPISTLMVFIAILIIGVYSLLYIPIDLYPEINPPFISVMTSYRGANAAEIETNVTKPLEDALNSLENLKEINSISYDNLSVITLEYNWGTNLDEATNDVRNALERVLSFLPEGADRPLIFRFSTTMMPILFYAVTAKESYMGIGKILEEKIINPINRINGVGSVGMMGNPKRVVYVDIDAKKAEAYNLSLEQVGAIIAAENFNLPSGNIKMGDLDYSIRVQGEFDESKDIENIVVGNFNGRVIYLKDIAKIEDRRKDISLDEKIKGQTGLRMFVIKQSGANTVQIARDVKKLLNNLVVELPSDVKITEIMDTSTFIKNAIRNLSSTLIYAFIFVFLVVYIFLGKWRATFIIILTIPISLIVSFVYLYLTGNTINIISLTSLAIAIGMVVDDAIVVVENISRHIERGSSPREAAIYATNEVWLAVIVTTLVIVAVFFPLTLVKGITGVMFNQLGWIVSITVTTSTLTAISLTPMLSSKLLKLKQKSKLTFYDRNILPVLDKIDDFYEKSLRWALRHKKLMAFILVIIFFGAFLLIPFIGTDFMPQSDESRLMVNMELQTGTRVEESRKVAERLEKILDKKYPEIVIYASSAGADDEGSFFSLFNRTGSNVINFMIRLKDPSQRKRSAFELADSIREEIKKFPEVVRYNVATSGGTATGFGGEQNVVVEIFGYDFDKTTTIAHKIKEKIEKLPQAVDVAVSRLDEKPEIMIKLDKEKLALHGLNSRSVSMAVRNRIAGMKASLFREDGKEYDIIVRYSEEYRNSVKDIEDITIVNNAGKKVKLKEIAKIDEYWSPPNIEHKRKERIVRVTAKPRGVSLGELAALIKREIKDIPCPADVMINVGGTYEEQMKSFKDLALLFAMSLILVYLVMASQFESFSMPFVIMFSIPFAITGVIIALFISGTTLNLIAGLGVVLLIGIVVKNGIVLVDYINLMRDRGYALNDAIALSGKSRLRPVLMTALTTALGMFPMAFFGGEGSELWQPMGITVIGGLVFSTLITLIIVPIMYAVLVRRGERDKKRKLREKMSFLVQNGN